MTELRTQLAQALATRYRIEGEIGSGGMAVVFLARDLKHDRKVALKLLRPELGHRVGVDRFLREIRIAAGLSHPNILRLFDSGEVDGLLFYVMPYVEGETLRDRLEREGALPPEEVVRIVGEVGEGIAHAHEAGVLHRDIKPENILFESGHALVADFGIARAIDAAAEDRLTATGLSVGTPTYMSPEQAAGEATDARSDVYGLGCLAYEMLAGLPPFTGPSAQAVIAGHLSRHPAPLREQGVEVPPGVERALERALSKDPEDRFATATELVDALKGAITAEARIAENQRATRRAWTRGVLAVGAAGAMLVGVLWVADELDAPAIERLAVLPASNMTRDPAQDYFVDGVHEALVSELQRAGIATIARQSVLQYRETDKPIRQIAGELGVDGLIQLSVGRETDSVFVDVSLFDGRTQLPLWTDSFASELRGVLGLYREVSRRIADEVGAALSERTQVRLAERPTLDPRVLEAVTLGKFHLGRGTPEGLSIALQHFESALEIDSLFAPAHVGVATAWGMRAQGLLIPPSEALPFVRSHLARALELDPDLAAARALEAGHTVWVDWEFESGAAAYRRALELDPNDARTQAFYGHVLLILGRWDEAVRQGELAMELDRLDPFVAGLHAAILASIGHAEDAIELIEATLEANPGAHFGLAALFNALHVEARHEEEFRYRRMFYASRGEDEAVEALDRGFEEGGYTAAFKRAAEFLASQARERGAGYMPAAQLYATAGEADLAMDLLQMAAEVRESPLPYIGVIPGFWSLHDHPRFQALARDVGVRPLRPAGR